MILLHIFLIALVFMILIYMVNKEYLSTMKLGICLVAIPVAFVFVTNINDGFLGKKIFFTPVQLESYLDGLQKKDDALFPIEDGYAPFSYKDETIPYPFPEDDGNIRLAVASGLSKDEDGSILLSSDQISNFEKLGLLDDPSFSFLQRNWNKLGGIKIENSPDSGKIIEIRLHSIGMYIRFYVGRYLLNNGRIKLLSADCSIMELDRVILDFLVTFSSFGFGILLIIIAAIQKLWPRPKKYSFLDPPDEQA